MLKFAAIIGFGLLVGACAQSAYVLKEGEFNRKAANFAREQTDISTVTVCYSSRGSTPAQVLFLARKECGKFGKTAQFIGQKYASCPLTTPVSARFSCLGDKTGAAKVSKSGAAAVTGGNRVNYDGILFSY